MTLRVIGPRADENIHRRAHAAAAGMDSYLERLVKLVPAEAIGAYPLLQSLAQNSPNVLPWGPLLVAWLLLLVVVVLRWHATRIPDEGPQWSAILISSVSFIIWVYVMKGDFGLLYWIGEQQVETVQNFIAIVLLVIWTILTPVLYRGDQ